MQTNKINEQEKRTHITYHVHTYKKDRTISADRTDRDTGLTGRWDSQDTQS